jgi:2-succinyl-6-hydroxy-2,4-cyclohexadiene-1-carboxylate synthase
LGGRLALYTALAYPEKFCSLILESANPGLTGALEREERAALDDRRAEQIVAGVIEAFIQTWYNLPLFQTLQRDPLRLKAIKSIRSTTDPHWAAKIVSQLSPGRQPSLWPRLGDLSLPVLLVAGELDAPYRAVTNRMAQKISHATIEIIPDAGHNTHLEQPEQFSRACFRHLSQTLA